MLKESQLHNYQLGTVEHKKLEALGTQIINLYQEY